MSIFPGSDDLKLCLATSPLEEKDRMQQSDVYWNGRYFFRLYRTPAEYKMRPYS